MDVVPRPSWGVDGEGLLTTTTEETPVTTDTVPPPATDDDGPMFAVDAEALERLATKDERKDLQLPMFEGRRIPALEIGLAGKLEIPLRTEKDVELANALRWGRKVTVCITIGEGPTGRDVFCDASVEKPGFDVKGKNATPTKVVKVTVDDLKFDV